MLDIHCLSQRIESYFDHVSFFADTSFVVIDDAVIKIAATIAIAPIPIIFSS